LESIAPILKVSCPFGDCFSPRDSRELTQLGCAEITKSGMTTRQIGTNHQSLSFVLVIRVRAAESSVGD
jgi:hypothetical protein